MNAISYRMEGSMSAENDDHTHPDHFPPHGRLAAVDYGTVRMGIAICDPDRRLVTPVEVYQVRSPKKDSDYFNQLARDERLTGYVVGLPIHCDGAESQKSLECRQFGKWLHEQTGLPVRLFDERFSTASAKDRLRSMALSPAKVKKRLDAVAALILLESFIESCRYHDSIMGQSIDRPPEGDDSIGD